MTDTGSFENDILLLENKINVNSTKPVVFYGSSSIRLWRSAKKDFPQYEILNLGFGGSSIDCCAYYFDRLIKPVDLRALIFYAGDNDIGEGRLPDEIFMSFINFYELFRSDFPQTKLTFVSIKPSPDRSPALDRIRITNRLIKQFLVHEENSYFLNIFDIMLDSEGEVRKELFLSDGLHMNRKGYLLWKEKFLEYKDKIF